MKNKIKLGVVNEIKKMIDDMKIGESEGWDLSHKFNCCPGDDMASAYNQALKDLRRKLNLLIKDLEKK